MARNPDDVKKQSGWQNPLVGDNQGEEDLEEKLSPHKRRAM